MSIFAFLTEMKRTCNVLLFSGGLDSLLLGEYLHKKNITYSPAFISYSTKQIEMNNAIKLHNKFKFTSQSMIFLSMSEQFRNSSPEKEIFARNLHFFLGVIEYFEKSYNETSGTIWFATHYPAKHFNGRYYNDCSPKFVKAINELLKSMNINWKIEAPFIDMTLEHMLYNSSINDLTDMKCCNKNSEENCGLCSKCLDVQNTIKKITISTGRNIKVNFNKSIYNPGDVKELKLKTDDNFIDTYRKVKPDISEFRIYTTKACNKICDFCSYKFRKNKQYIRESKVLTHEEWIENLNKYIKQFKPESLMFSGVEPLLNERESQKLFKLVQQLRATFPEIRMYLNTNMKFLIEKDLSRRYLNEALITFNMIYCSLNDKSTEQTLKYLLDMNKTYCTLMRKVFVPYMVVNKDNKETIFNWIEQLAEEKFNNFYFRFEYPFSDTMDRTYCYEEHKEVVKELLQTFNEYDIIFRTPIDWKYVNDSELYDVGTKVVTNNKAKLIYTFYDVINNDYLNNLTINFDGSITGSPKHSYEENYSNYVIGNIKNDRPEDIELVIKKEITNRIL